MLHGTLVVGIEPNCGIEQRAQTIFGRAAITFGIGPHFYLCFFDDDDAAFTTTHHNFFDDDSRDSTSTTSQCFFDDVVH